MDDFLKELGGLLIKHRACIVRSASVNHELVVSVTTKENGVTKTQEAVFDEDITDDSIRHKWYQEKRYS